MEDRMKTNFDKLEQRLFEGLYNSDLERINYTLRNITGSTLVSGVGGSSVVADYTAKILAIKNGIIARSVEPRDMCYMPLNGYSNVIACSYSGNNYGADISFNNDLNHYLLSSNNEKKDGITTIPYYTGEKEHSFISLAATLVPCSIMLNYYLDNRKETIVDSTDPYTFGYEYPDDLFEIFTGYETSTASKFLESTLTESGIGIPIVHDKYAYCHGRSTLSYTRKATAIYFNLGTDLDKLMLKELPKYYTNVIVLDTSNDPFSEYILLLKCMYLAKEIAEYKSKSLSKVEYSPIVRKLYKYNDGI